MFLIIEQVNGVEKTVSAHQTHRAAMMKLKKLNYNRADGVWHVARWVD